MAALISVLIAITLTGLSRTSASFQARSAFTGSGFTTQESEAVVKHPVRRRIVMWLMFLGNAGIVTVISSLVLTKEQQENKPTNKRSPLNSESNKKTIALAQLPKKPLVYILILSRGT